MKRHWRHPCEPSAWGLQRRQPKGGIFLKCPLSDKPTILLPRVQRTHSHLSHFLSLRASLPVRPEVKFTQSCPTLCAPMYYTVHEILQARIVEWIAFPFSRGSSQPKDRALFSHTADWFFTSQTQFRTKARMWLLSAFLHTSVPEAALALLPGLSPTLLPSGSTGFLEVSFPPEGELKSLNYLL